MNKLDYIRDILQNHTAHSFAKMMLEKEKQKCILATMNTLTGIITERETDYQTYMSEMWGNGNEPMELLIERSYYSKIQQYGKYCNLYASFIKNGKVFVISLKERLVSFLTVDEKDRVELTTHYNPNNVDLITLSFAGVKKFSEAIERGEYDISKDDKALILRCDALSSVS